MDYHNIMLSYSNPDRDTEALHAALELAYRHEAQLTVLQVNGQCANDQCTRHYLYSVDELAQQINKANGHGVPVQYMVADCGNFVQATLNQAADFDLLVVADSHTSCFTDHIDPSLIEKLTSPAQLHQWAMAV
jgi:hypothetical protein